MSRELQILLDRESAAPGETVTGSVSWYCSKQPKQIIVQLNWRTEGRGSTDKGTAVEERILCSSEKGNAGFSLRVPDNCHSSYRGVLVSIVWSVKCIADISWKIDPKESVPLVISSTGEPFTPPPEYMSED